MKGKIILLDGKRLCGPKTRGRLELRIVNYSRKLCGLRGTRVLTKEWIMNCSSLGGNHSMYQTIGSKGFSMLGGEDKIIWKFNS